MQIPDGLYDVLFTVNESKSGGEVVVQGTRARLILLGTHLPEGRRRLEAWLELDRELLHHSPDKSFWHYAYLGDLDFSKRVDTPQGEIFPAHDSEA